LAALGAARRPAQAAAVTTFLAIALGAALFSLDYRATLDRNARDQADFAAGAAWRVVGAHSVPVGVPALRLDAAVAAALPSSPDLAPGDAPWRAARRGRVPADVRPVEPHARRLRLGRAGALRGAPSGRVVAASAAPRLDGRGGRLRRRLPPHGGAVRAGRTRP